MSYKMYVKIIGIVQEDGKAQELEQHKHHDIIHKNKKLNYECGKVRSYFGLKAI